MQFAGNAGSDQPAHLRKLIRAFVVSLQSTDTVEQVDEQRKLKSDCTDAHAYLDRSSHMT